MKSIDYDNYDTGHPKLQNVKYSNENESQNGGYFLRVRMFVDFSILFYSISVVKTLRKCVESSFDLLRLVVLW